MLPDDLKHITLIPAEKLQEGFHAIPPDPGVYLLFIRGGRQLLEASSYFDTDSREPLEIDGYTHLYTGAAQNLRFRLTQHFLNPDQESSSPRKTLFALEQVFGAISKAKSYGPKIEDQDSLTDWMFENILVGYAMSPQPFSREGEIVRRYGSPFNIAGRRNHIYSKWLMSWRATAYPPKWAKRIPAGRAFTHAGGH